MENKIKNYKGIQNELEKYIKDLEKPFNHKIIYYDDNENIIKYKGETFNNLYNGRGILYEESYENEIKYDGYFKKGKYDGFGKLYRNGKLIYEGLFINDLYNCKGILYHINGKRKYEGEFKNGEYQGNGILYYGNNINTIYYKGIFKNNEFESGILYGIKGEKIYEGEFRKNIPKEGKNLKLYNLNGFLYYEGEIFNYSYNGKGKIYGSENNLIFDGEFKNGEKIYGILYKDGAKKYEGEFENNMFNGFGKLYDDKWKGNNLLYEGNFKNGKIFGEGIKYIGSKKIEGNFKFMNPYKGMYFNPINNNLNEKEVHLFNQNDFISKIGNLEIYENKFKFIEEVPYAKIDNYKGKNIKILLISQGSSGKTQIVLRIAENCYDTSLPSTIGVDNRIKKYIYKNELNTLQIWDANGRESSISVIKYYLKGVDILIIVFDLSEENYNFDNWCFNLIKDNEYNKKKLIYLVGNKIDLYCIKLEYYREKAKAMIDSGLIDKYFEVSAKTGEGIEQFSNILKIDSSIYQNYNKNKNLVLKYGLEEYEFQFQSKLNKYYNY